MEEKALDVSKLQVGSIYKYKELCCLLGEEVKRGGSQKHQIEDWRRYFEWEKITTQKYRITKIHEAPLEKVDGRINNGGTREGAGRKETLKDEFDFLLGSFLEFKFNKNSQVISLPIFFSRSEIAIYFGIYPEDFYERPRRNGKKLRTVEAKLSGKLDSLVLSKIAKFDGVESYGWGCIGYRSKAAKKAGVYEYGDELLDFWNDHAEKYMEQEGVSNLGGVASRGKWQEMEEYISKKSSDYMQIRRLRKVEISLQALPEKIEYDAWEDRKTKCQKAFNDYVIESCKEAFGKKRDKKLAYYDEHEMTPEDIEEYEEMFGRINWDELDCEEDEECSVEYVEALKDMVEKLVRI